MDENHLNSEPQAVICCKANLCLFQPRTKLLGETIELPGRYDRDPLIVSAILVTGHLFTKILVPCGLFWNSTT